MTIHRSFPSSAVPCTVAHSWRINALCFSKRTLALFLFLQRSGACSTYNAALSEKKLDIKLQFHQTRWAMRFELWTLILDLINFPVSQATCLAIVGLTQSCLQPASQLLIIVAKLDSFFGKMYIKRKIWKSNTDERLLCYRLVFLFTRSSLPTPWSFQKLSTSYVLERSGFRPPLFFVLLSPAFMHQLIL